MKKRKKIGSTEYPQTEQHRYPLPDSELRFTNACPRDTEYDLVPEPSRNNFGYHPETSGMDEQTFRVVKKGNCP